MKARLLTAVVMACSMVAAARAEILYQDTFSGSGALNGQTPTTGANTWTANSSLSESGGEVASSASSKSGYAAWLPITIEEGKIYTLTCDFQMYSGATYGSTGDWFAAGFGYALTVNTGTGYAFDDYGRAWAIAKAGDSTSNYFQLGRGWKAVSDTSSSLGYVSYDNATFGNDKVFHTLKVVLNATDLLHWTMATYLDNATTPYNTYDWVANNSTQPGVNRVGFAVSQSSRYVDNFTVSVAVPTPTPEPGTLALLAVSLVGLVTYAWRKRK
ncbi:MAG: PEP-CTERM sorting domain-containing protein [Planctomycetaceae bacterium]|nr:PEP-CTERM sorting domain-containing protein [Planctomycetaceae bacterium]